MTKFGTAIFTEMTLLAQEHDAINLGQGAPDSQAPAIVHERAIEAIRDGHNQYAPDSASRSYARRSPTTSSTTTASRSTRRRRCRLRQVLPRR